MAAASEVAQWLVDHIRSEKMEYQEIVVQLIAEHFPDWDHVNNDGNPVVHPRVLYQFKKLHDQFKKFSARWVE